MDLSIPPTPLPGLQPPGAATGNRAFDGPRCLSKPHRYDLATSHAIFMITSFDILGGPDILVLFGFLIWPVSFIGGIIWGFTRGNKYFAYGLVTIALILLLLFLALIALIIMAFGAA